MNDIEKAKFEAWLNDNINSTIPDCGYESLEGDMAFLAWQKCADGKDAEIEFLTKAIEISHNDTKYFEMERDRVNLQLRIVTKEFESLKLWKKSAIATMPDMQAIGKAIEVPLGESIHDKILTSIEELKAENKMLNNKLLLSVNALMHIEYGMPEC